MKIILVMIMLYSSTSFAALDKDRCGSAVVAALKVLNPSISGSVETNLLPYWKVICDELIKEITANMEITTTVSIPNAQAGSSTLPGTGVENTIQ